jgi:hypothetical protein
MRAIQHQSFITSHRCVFLFTAGNVGVPIKLLYEAERMKITVKVSNCGVFGVDITPFLTFTPTYM